MPVTYIPLATQTLGSAAASVTFSSIPGTYTDLVLVIAGIFSTAGSTSVVLQLNSDTGTNYSNTFIYGNGTSVTSGRGSNQTNMQLGYMSGSAQTNTIINLMNYSNTTTFKTALGRGNSMPDFTIARVALWRNTAAVTSIKVLPDSALNFDTGSTFSLYGIASA